MWAWLSCGARQCYGGGVGAKPRSGGLAGVGVETEGGAGRLRSARYARERIVVVGAR